MKKIYLPADGRGNSILEIVVADTFWARLKGLLGTAALPENKGLLLCNCNSVRF
ncbi:MAG: hypothetical protein H6Q67_1919 [Firmicutes bacterium]|nr:hypothetical protein [Bacillota bacterium]